MVAKSARRAGAGSWLGKTHANGKLCRTETNIESAAGPIETEVDARGARFSSSVAAQERLLHVEIRFATPP